MSDESAENENLLSVAVPRPLDQLFTYRIPAELESKIRIGSLIRVPFGRSKTHAYVVEPIKSREHLPEGIAYSALKKVIGIENSEVFIPEDLLNLCKWASSYYQTPIGEVLSSAIPASVLREPKRKKKPQLEQSTDFIQATLTEEQEVAVKLLDESRRLFYTEKKQGVALLDGITGSGKTEVYMELARRTLAEGRGVIVLVPEIALTPQLYDRFNKALGCKIGIWHSAVADGKRREEWLELLRGELRVVVGARSSVFAPIQNLGLVIVDEEHDSSYKQEDRFRYSARDLAIVRARQSNAFTVLGSATPSIESLERVRDGKFLYSTLKNRVSSTGRLADIELVDLREHECVPEIQAPFAQATLDALKKTIDDGNQAMIFLNRRGFAAFLVCQDCGETEGCPNCSISLTMHKRRRELRCHLCGFSKVIPDLCQKCQSGQLLPMGAGTESLEEELPRLIPAMKSLRLDRDQVTSTRRLGEILSDFREGKANVLLGTQMLVKGHDFPKVTLVVVVLADMLFRWPDYRAPERAYQILTQVAGRAGRGDTPGNVMIQTYSPDHPVLQVMRGIMSKDQFLEDERLLRQELRYPPFGRLARLRVEDENSNVARTRANGVAQAIAQSEIEILGPSEALVERVNRVFRWDILLKAMDIQALQRGIRVAKDHAAKNGWSLVVDLDPSSVG